MRPLQVMKFRGGAPVVTGTVVSRLLFNGPNNSTTFTDETGRIWEAAGAVKISTAQSVSGGSSAYFDGSGGYVVTAAANDFTFGALESPIDFAIRLRIRLAALGSDMTLIGNYIDSARGFSLQYRPTISGFRFGYGDNAILDANWSPSIDTWYTIELSRSGITFRVAINGEILREVQHTVSISDGDSLLIGALRHKGNTIQRTNGYIDDVVIVKGSSVVG